MLTCIAYFFPLFSSRSSPARPAFQGQMKIYGHLDWIACFLLMNHYRPGSMLGLQMGPFFPDQKSTFYLKHAIFF